MSNKDVNPNHSHDLSVLDWNWGDVDMSIRTQSEGLLAAPISTKEQVPPLDSSQPAAALSATQADTDQGAVPIAEPIAERPSPSGSGERIGTKLLALSNPAHMDIIDKLRDLGVHEFVELPQLVVVGDQSSGKSSVLEAIADVPFPRDATLCTKFATNITLRRQSSENVHVSIIPGKSATQEKAKRLRSWSYETKKLDGDNFLKALDLASKVMGVRISSDAGDDGWKTFSDDIFKIEITGPHLINLSVIDVPGLFRTKQDGETTDEDIAFVEEMVKNYIQNSRTIILAVLACNNDIATQSILRMVAQADPEGQRTLGVLTKPDLLDKGTEYTIMDLVEGKKHRLNLGYYVVRNRSKMEQSCARSEMEGTESRFFNAYPWSQLPRDRVGLDALLVRLQQLHGDVIDREFPAIKSQVAKRLMKCKKDLSMMGHERNSEVDQRKFLERIATQFQAICRDAMSTSYHQHEILRKCKSMRLPTSVADRKEQFGKEMTWKGHSIAFIDTDVTVKESADTLVPSLGDISPAPVDEDEVSRAFVEEYGEKEQAHDHLDKLPSSIKSQFTKVKRAVVKKQFPELDALFLPVAKTSPPDHKDIKHWIEKKVRETRSYSLEVIGLDIISLLWKEQSEKWFGISSAFINDIIVLVHRFIHGLLGEVCPDERTRNSILLLIKDDLLAKYRTAIETVEFLFKVEQSGTLLTENHYFSETLHKVRDQRIKDTTIYELKKLSVRGSVLNKNDKPMKEENLIRESDLAKLRFKHTNKSNLEHAVDDIHDILYCYYKTARKRYVDGVLMQAMDWFLLKGSPSPLHLFTSSYVSDFTPEQLERVAGEDTATKNRRHELKKEIHALEAAEDVIRGF